MEFTGSELNWAGKGELPIGMELNKNKKVSSNY